MRFVVGLLCLVISPFSFSGSIDLGAANGYTVFIKDSFEHNTGDLQGYHAVGGAIINNSGQADYFGHMIDAFDIQSPETTLSSSSEFDSAFTELATLSDSLAALADTGTVNKPWSSKLEFTAAAGTEANDVHIFNIDASQLTHVTEIAFNGTNGGQVVVNVTGDNIDHSWGGQYINGTHLNYSDATLAGREEANVLFNFVEATNIELDGSLYASVLAPTANITATGPATFWGQVIANSWNTSSASQFNFDLFGIKGDVTVEVPEPPVLFAFIGALALMIRQKRKALSR